jgi:hypothetical protein
VATPAVRVGSAGPALAMAASVGTVTCTRWCTLDGWPCRW